MAKRGDIIVVHRRRFLYGEDPYDMFDVGVVTNITREGRAKRWRHVAGKNPVTLHPNAVEQYYILGQDKVDVDAAVKTALARKWPGDYPGKPYDSLREVREAFRPHLKQQPSST